MSETVTLDNRRLIISLNEWISRDEEGDWRYVKSNKTLWEKTNLGYRRYSIRKEDKTKRIQKAHFIMTPEMTAYQQCKRTMVNRDIIGVRVSGTDKEDRGDRMEKQRIG